MKRHKLDDCYLVWYGPYLRPRDSLIEEICEQGYADRHYGGINQKEAREARRR